MRTTKKRKMAIHFVMISMLCFSSCGMRKEVSMEMDGKYMQEQPMEMLEVESVASESELDLEKVEMNTEEYDAFEENSFLDVSLHPLSTFGADVDTASYTNIRRMIQQGMLPEEIPTSAVRLEEMLNYFQYDYALPEEGEKFGISIDAAPCPWKSEHGLLRLGIRTEEITFEESEGSNFVFLLDVSGSMNDANKLPLLKQAFSMLTENLGEKDRISIVTYAGADSVLLEGAYGTEKDKILEVLYFLEADGATHGSAGIETAYELAEEYFIPGGNNRVLLATDGDLNVGLTSESDLKELVEEKRETGIFLSVLGFGDGNLKDNKMEILADYGNGNYSYIDSIMEARRVLVDQMGSTLLTVAKDVKFQVEFNPMWISQYRLLGYENRMLNPQDFTDDTKDAGELGAGHTVTVLYEVVWANDKEHKAETSEQEIQLKYQEVVQKDTEEIQDEWGTLKIRYKNPEESMSQENHKSFGSEIYEESVEEAGMLLEASVAEFGMLLKNSPHKGDSSYSHILEQWSSKIGEEEGEIAGFLSLVNMIRKRTEE